MCSAKHHAGDLARVGGVPSLLKKICQDATAYFLILSTGHLLFLCFEIFTPVSDRRADSLSAAYDKPHADFDETYSWRVSRRPKNRRRGKFDGT